jgi:hypothetical protein
MIIKSDYEAKKMFFDRIQHVDSRKVSCTTRRELEEATCRADHNNIEWNGLPPEDANGRFDYSFLCVVAERETIPPSSMILALAGDVYLLNDINGKTIERL